MASIGKLAPKRGPLEVFDSGAHASKSQSHEVQRRRIMSSGDPVGFALLIMQGRPFRCADPNDPTKLRVQYPTLDQRIKMAAWLGNKVLPDLKAVEVSGDPDRPVTVQTVEEARRKFLEGVVVLAADVSGGDADSESEPPRIEGT